MNTRFPILYSLSLVIALAGIPREAQAEKLQEVTRKAWEEYVKYTEERIDGELKRPSISLVIDPKTIQKAVINQKGVHIEKMTTRPGGREIPVKSGLIHHWIGAIFVPKATVDSLLRWVQDYNQHYKYFKEVDRSRLDSRDGDTFKVFLGLTRTKVITVHYNTYHTALYRRHGAGRASSSSFTTKIAEVKAPGTPSEKELPVEDDGGYLWRLNSYWRFVEQDGGVVVECESISLSRSIPGGWFTNLVTFGQIKGFVESIPKESLENTLTTIRDAKTK